MGVAPVAPQEGKSVSEAHQQLSTQDVGRDGGGELAFTWRGTRYFQEYLPEQLQKLKSSFPNPPSYNCLRDAINGAYGELYEFLPLDTKDFIGINTAEALGETGSMVVAEKVVRVPDHNRQRKNRVDFFVYKDNGEVVRYHPGNRNQQDMHPHTMPINSVLFHRPDAAQWGVGNVLHALPPAIVERGGLSLSSGGAYPASPFLLATRAHMDQLCTYDVKSVNWRGVDEALSALPNHDHTVRWSDGKTFPWWVWLAKTGEMTKVVNGGIIEVFLEVKGGEKYVLVQTMEGDFRLCKSSRTRKMRIIPLQRYSDN